MVSMNSDIIQGFLNIVQSDNSLYPKAIAGYEGSNDVKTVRHSVYGVCSSPPKGSLGILFKIDSMNGVRYGIYDDATNRFKNLSEGEVQLGNYSTQASIKFDKDGNVTVNVPNGNLTATVNGNMTSTVYGSTNITTDNFTVTTTGVGGSTINGNLVINGNISANNFISLTTGFNFNSHIHTGDSGGSTSSPVG